MDKHEIDVGKTSFCQSLLYLSFCVLVVESACWDLAGEEDIFPFDARLLDSLPTWSFVPIGGSRINLKSFNKSAKLVAF
jgi:hypothetical protein